MIDGEYFTFFRAIRTNENGVVSKRKASRGKKRVVKKFDGEIRYQFVRDSKVSTRTLFVNIYGCCNEL